MRNEIGNQDVKSVVDRRLAEHRLERVRPPPELRFGTLTRALQELGRTLEGLGSGAEDAGKLPRAIASALGAQWIAFRERGGDGIAGHCGETWDRLRAEQVTRRIDFAFISRVPRGRLVRLTGPVLDRIPRCAGTGICELLIYVDPVLGRRGGLVVIALEHPSAVELDELEALVKTWIGLGDLRARLGRAREQDHRVEMGTRAACALHDLRHELTVSSLELDRLFAESDPIARENLDRIRTAITTARGLCEGVGEADLGGSVEPTRVVVAALLRKEADTAHSVSGRGQAIHIEIRCDESLEFFVDVEILSRITRNLVLNAIESSPDGERVLIEAAFGAEDELVLRVIDHGRGMSATDSVELSRFGRSGRGGWGIGTASIEDGARRIRAVRTVVSRVGSGTRVELRIPPQKRERGSRAADPRNRSRPGGTRG